MGESGNIEALAEEISQDVFKWFKWSWCPLRNVNWKCVSDHHTNNTHPSDVVYYYNDPYTGKTSYINTDLKSYKKGSINNTSIIKALNNLALSVECANISSDWQSKYISPDANIGEILGLLFIFNHDNEFDKELSEIIEKLDSKKLHIPEDVFLALFDPLKIKNLLNIITDLEHLSAKKQFPADNYTFFYPDLTMSRRFGGEWEQPATIEALTAPWLIIKHGQCDEYKEGFLIYYHNEGNTVDEFIYLVDALSHYQMLLSDKPIRIRLTNSSADAINNFEQAKLSYMSMWGADEARERRLNTIKASKIKKVVPNYCPMEIGMREND